MAENETTTVTDPDDFSSLAPDAPADAPSESATQDAPASDTEDAAESPDASADAAEDASEGDAAEAPESTATPTEAADAHQKAVAELDGLRKQQSDVDAQLEQIDKDLTDGKILGDEAGAKINILISKQRRIERQITTAENSVSQKEKENVGARAKAMEEHWASLGKQNSDLVDGKDAAAKAAAATTLCKNVWDEEYTKAAARKGLHPERIAGIAEANYEMRLKAMRAQKGKPGSTQARRTTPDRLTPGSGSGPISPTKDSAAAVAERTLGPLSQYKF